MPQGTRRGRAPGKRLARLEARWQGSGLSDGDQETTRSGGGFQARPPGGGTAKLPLFRKCPLPRLLRLRCGGARARLRCCYSNQETAAVPNGLESTTFPGVRERLAHA